MVTFMIEFVPEVVPIVAVITLIIITRCFLDPLPEEREVINKS